MRFIIKQIILFLLISLININSTMAQDKDNNGIKAHIMADLSNGYIDVKATCHSLKDENGLKYELEMVRSGHGGSSRNTQKGKFDIRAGESRILSRQRINHRDNDELSVILGIFRGNDKIATDSLNSDDFSKLIREKNINP